MPLFFCLVRTGSLCLCGQCLLIVRRPIAVVKANGYPAWVIPALHEFFVRSFLGFWRGLASRPG